MHMVLKKKKLIYPLLFVSVLVILLTVLALKQCAPFGNYSLVYNDADYQYLDFYAYLKDILQGKQSVIYSFSNLLGQSGISLFSYYLSSPFNLLIVFFDKASLISFYDIVWVLKLSTASVTCAFYLNYRFEKQLDTVWVYILSLCYGLMQYSMSQACNLMWLDGVYMLPMILAGVYAVVKKHAISPLLSISVGLSILFNWYSAGINCLLSIFFIFFEYFLSDHTKSVSDFFITIVKYGISMLLGVCLSAFLFLPTVLLLMEGKGGSFDWNILTTEIFGNISAFMGNYTIGSEASYSNMALYCGCVPLLGSIGIFFSKRVHIQKKIVYGCMLALCVMLCCWTPLYFLFSMFKEASSYYFRYGYTASFILIFLCASYLNVIEKEDKRRILISGTITCVCFGICRHFTPFHTGRGKVTLALLIISALCLYLYHYHKQILRITLTCLCIGELSLNVWTSVGNHKAENVSDYHDYSVNEQKLIHDIQDQDYGTYRITQTTTRGQNSSNESSPRLNESLAYNYMSVEGYVSTVSFNENAFLDHLGYRSEFKGIITCKSFSIPSTDTLLGVKYVLSPDDMNGLEKLVAIKPENNKSVYLNPYALPMALPVNVSMKDMPVYEGNPFTYQNALFQWLSGTDKAIYIPCSYTKDIQDGKTIYHIDCPEGNVSLFGNLVWQPWNAGKLSENINVNGKDSLPYGAWLSKSVFPIQKDTDETSIYVSVPTDQKDFFSDEQFYALDLDALKQVTDLLKRNISDIEIHNNSVKIHVSSDLKQYLYTSVPYESGWHIENNGKEVKPQLLDDCMIMIPLEKGNNDIIMTYHVPGLKCGIVISILACAAVLMMCYFYISDKHAEVSYMDK